MAAPARLNILLTHSQPWSSAPMADLDSPPPWYQTVARLLEPLGVHTYEATSGNEAMNLIEQHPIHLAVVDTRISQSDDLGLLRILERIRQRALAADYAPRTEPSAPPAYRMQVRIEARQDAQSQSVQVRFSTEASPAVVWPTVILLTPRHDQGMLREALKFNAFSVMNDPVDPNLMLDLMARAMRRFHHNQWPL